MPISLSGSLELTGSLTVTGGITMSGSIASSSYATDATNAANSTLFNNTASSVFATTGSNTFTGTQYISNTNNATGFSSTTSSIYTDGGLQVTKNAYFSSSMFIKGNLTVFGTQSVSFITSSQLNISTNLITVNTDTPSIRFGGLAVYDSGSTGLTGSILWDSQDNHWIYTNPSGSSYSGGMFISGPRNTGSIGDEQGTTLNAIMKGMGGDHITSSGIFESGSGNVGIGTSVPAYKLDVNGTGNFNGGLTLGASSGFPSVGLLNRSSDSNLYIVAASSGFLLLDNSQNTMYQATPTAHNWNISNSPKMTLNSSGNVGIGTTSPTGKFEIASLANTYASAPAITFTDTAGDASSNRWIVGNIATTYGTFNIASAPTPSSTTYTPRLSILSNGNVGIGTTSPAYKLDVSGTTRINGGDGLYIRASTGDQANFFVSPSTGATYIDYAGFLAFRGSSEYIRITSGGRVGIGQTNPGVALSVAGQTEPWQLALTSVTGTVGAVIGSPSANVLAFGDWGGTERMRITSGGNVGIGTTNPATLLQVSGSSTDNLVFVNNTNANGYGSVRCANNTNKAAVFGVGGSSVGAPYANTGYIYTDPDVDLTFSVGSSQKMRITSAGLVGIGTSPLSGQKLIVNIASNQNIRFSSEGGQATISGVNGDATAFGMLNIDGNVVRIQSNSGGNVSIGTATDFGYKLNLNGQPGANGYTAWTNWSDLRLKENITDLEATNVLDKICTIRPVTYNYNELSGFDEATRSRRISGFIAQELMEVFPDMVGTITKQDTEYYDTNLSNLNLYLVKAIQELTARVQELENK